MKFHTKTRELHKDERGYKRWVELKRVIEIDPENLAILICDMWDKHWSRSATERVDAMAMKLNKVMISARHKGIQIIHAPSETLDFYSGTKARKRIENMPLVTPIDKKEVNIPPLPIDDSDGGSETNWDEFEQVNSIVWTRQHEAIKIDHDRDIISDLGIEIFS